MTVALLCYIAFNLPQDHIINGRGIGRLERISSFPQNLAQIQ